MNHNLQFSTLKPKQNDQSFAENIWKCIFIKEKFDVVIEI